MYRYRSHSESPDIIPESTKIFHKRVFWTIYFYFLGNLIYNRYIY